MVPHRGTNLAAPWLTSQIGRDAVLSRSYGRGYFCRFLATYNLLFPDPIPGIRKRGMHFFSRFSRLIEPYSTFFIINLSLYNVGPKPSILSGPNGGEPSKIR